MYEIEGLSQIPKVEPQTAYCCYKTVFKRKLTYLMYITISKIKKKIKRESVLSTETSQYKIKTD